MAAWKDLERTVAKELKGFRIPRGRDFSQSLPDVIADASYTFNCPSTKGLIAECKYRSKQPLIDLYKKQIDKATPSKYYTVILKDKDNKEIYLTPLEDLKHIKSLYMHFITVKKVIPKYLTDAFKQSFDYATDLNARKRIRLQYCISSGLDPIDCTWFTTFIPVVVLGARREKIRIVAHDGLGEVLSFL